MSQKILVIEDNEMNLDILVRRLSKHGFEIIAAVDGEEGILKAVADRPNIILMDMSLPGIDGWEATRQLKRIPETSKIPIIALTAHAMHGDKEKALKSGCDEYETKPVDFNRLLEKINKLLGVNTQ